MIDLVGQSVQKKSMFDLSKVNLMSCNMGDLVPVYTNELLPGDSFDIEPQALMRLAPLKFPVFAKIRARLHYFVVPLRIIWSNFENFITGGEDGKDATVWPYMNVPAPAKGSLADYLGLPIGVNHFSVSALLFRAYSLIWNEWYRDQNTMSKLTVSKADGEDTTTNQTLQKVCWRKDYFTAATPWAQRGDAVLLPLGLSAPVTGTIDDDIPVGIIAGGGGFHQAYNDTGNNGVLRTDYTAGQHDAIAKAEDMSITGEVDLSSATATDIVTVRTAFQLQRWAELNMRGGSRYTEILQLHFNTTSPDARLQRPEYIGGTATTVIISEIPQTSATGATGTPQGNLAGHGYATVSSKHIRYSATEHCVVIGLLSIIPDTAYQQGVHRSWERKTRYDYYWPSFAHVGAQAIKNREIFAQDDQNVNQITWAFQDRYEEYRQAYDEVHGDMLNDFDFMHMGRKFAALPAYGSSFVSADPTTRIWPVADGNHVWVTLGHKVKALRPIPLIGDPGYVDHQAIG